MNELLTSIAKGLVEDPDAVVVEQDDPTDDGTIVFHLHVAPDDMGRNRQAGSHCQSDSHCHASRNPPGNPYLWKLTATG